MAKFGDVIRVLRIKRGYSQEKLAKMIGLTRSRIANYECGTREPDLDTVELFADFFDVSMDDLTGRDESKEEAILEKQKPQRRKWRMISAGTLTMSDEELDRFYQVARAMHPDKFPPVE